MEPATSSEFLVKFWGVRGSIPTPGQTTVRYGGNTSCVEMEIGGRRIIFDGGTGLQALSKDLMQQLPPETYMFFYPLPLGSHPRVSLLYPRLCQRPLSTHPWSRAGKR